MFKLIWLFCVAFVHANNFEAKAYQVAPGLEFDEVEDIVAAEARLMQFILPNDNADQEKMNMAQKACDKLHLPEAIIEREYLKEELERLSKELKRTNQKLIVQVADIDEYYKMQQTFCHFRANETVVLSSVPIVPLNPIKLLMVRKQVFGYTGKICSVDVDFDEKYIWLNESSKMVGLYEKGDYCFDYLNKKICRLPLPEDFVDAHSISPCLGVHLNGSSATEIRNYCGMVCNYNEHLQLVERPEGHYSVNYGKAHIEYKCLNQTITYTTFIEKGAIQLHNKCDCNVTINGMNLKMPDSGCSNNITNPVELVPVNVHFGNDEYFI